MSAYPSRVAVDEAIALIRDAARSRPLGSESLAFNRAGGRVLADAVRAPIDLPSFDNSRMDGVAFAHASLASEGPTRLRLVGEQYAGVAQGLRVGPGECVRITTGAPLPEGTDTVA
ncbi:MAG TPA: molybdopterin molybdenumtransferase MoeA, partial [Pseudoxanthomonas mexicana]|nr:molybdopterin molybdenumtransferase MoeA [Pseudoxanthomonas mexicana]